MSVPRCPFCFQKHDFEKSQLCLKTINARTGKAEEVSLSYIREYYSVPPLPLVTIGFPKVGKTTYLAALTMMLENLDRTWHETTYQINDPESHASIQEIRRQAITGDLPPQTKKGILRPLFINVLDVPGRGSNCLVLYDTPGEIFETLNGTESGDYIQSLKMVYNIWFMISLTDLEEQQYQMRINDLLFSYIDAMKRMGWPLKGRNLIVVYTKGDKIIPYANDHFPAVVKEHFENDPFQNLTLRNRIIPDQSDFSLEEYAREMQTVSDALAKYTAEEIIDGGRSFINLAKKNGLGLYFTMVSATGREPRSGRLEIESARYCVLDPYLWALYLANQEPPHTKIRLILDASSKAERIYSQELKMLADSLNDIGDVTVHYLGQARPASVVDQAPPLTPPRIARCRLIGPILEKITAQDLVIVLACGEVIDLAEYNTSEWHERLLLIAVGEDQYQNWPNTLVLRPQDPRDLIIREFRRFFSKFLNE